MSAIIGIFHANKDPIPFDHTNNLMKSLLQYPSDNINIWKNDNIFLGCHAQWITPESIGEQLPYYDYERQLAITADAIIDNRDDLFTMLQIDQEHRKSMPDSKLILLAYYKWGEEMPKKLLGDFAFMIWDEKEHKLFGARDFSGARTLYFYRNESKFAFSTTIEPLFTLPYVDKELNEEWLAEFIAIPTMVEAVDMFSTVYKSIQQIPPSHSITVKDGKVSFSRYCTIEVNETLKLKSNEEYEEAFRDVFQKAVKARVRTHGEVGSHLSGGLDSGSVVSFAAPELKKENKQLHTFSYIPEDSFEDWTPNNCIADESQYIKDTVSHAGNISDNYLSFDGKEPLSEIDSFLETMEMPYKFFENSFWLKGINEEAVQKGIKVMLNGARGNHSVSWGSRSLNIEYYASLFKKLKWINLYKELDYYSINFHTGKSDTLPIIAKRVFPEIASLFKKSKFDEDMLSQLINPMLASKTNIYEKLQNLGIDIAGSSEKNIYENRMNHFRQLYSWNKSGTINTKLSLRYGLWDRDPTNDINVISFCLSLPIEQYVQNGMGRSIIRRATNNRLPDSVRLNHQKRGIQGADTLHRMSDSWYDFIDNIEELISDPTVTDIFNIHVIKKALSYIESYKQPETIYTDEFKILTRSLIVYKFLMRLKGGDKNEEEMATTCIRNT